MPKCHDGWRLSVSALGTCFATFRKPSSIMQIFVITSSSLATKKCSSKSRNTKLCATPRKQWIYEIWQKMDFWANTQETMNIWDRAKNGFLGQKPRLWAQKKLSLFHSNHVLATLWRAGCISQDTYLLYVDVYLPFVMLSLSLLPLPSWFMRQEWKRKQVTKVTKCPWLHFLKCHRLTTLNPQEVVCCLFCICSFGSSYLCICVFDIQPVNCQCFYWTAFIFM